jgi:hypothetical protein
MAPGWNGRTKCRTQRLSSMRCMLASISIGFGTLDSLSRWWKSCGCGDCALNGELGDPHYTGRFISRVIQNSSNRPDCLDRSSSVVRRKRLNVPRMCNRALGSKPSKR